MCEDECFRHLESLIEIESSDHRFERIGENIGILISTRERLTTRELDDVCELESLRDLGEIASAHECGSYIGELSLGLTREFTKECLSDREFEYRVTEVFETFIGLAISYMCFIEHTSMDTREYVESRVFRKDLERREEGSYLRFELFTIVAERVTHKEIIDYRLQILDLYFMINHEKSKLLSFFGSPDESHHITMIWRSHHEELTRLRVDECK